MTRTDRPHASSESSRKRRGHHPLIQSLLDLRGNARACVYTEPMFGIPYSLYLPFFSVYMYRLGLDDRLIGIVASIGFFVQIFTALIGGLITDRLGRRRTTLIFDIVSWSVPLLLWALARDWRWFVVAAIINAFMQVPNNSWTCLLVEDAEPDKLLSMYTWVNMSGQLAVFFAPLSGLLVRSLGVVPAMRILLLIACLSITLKSVILYRHADETEEGKRRMAATRHETLGSQLKGYGAVIREILRTPETRLVLFIFVLLSLTTTISNNYLSLFLTQNVGLDEAFLPMVPMVRAVIMLVFFFAVQSLLGRFTFRVPMLTGLLVSAVSQVLLILAARATPALLIPAILGESVGLALVMPQKDVLTTRWVNPRERSRTLSVLYILQLALTTPFGWLTGELSSRYRPGVFMLNGAIFVLCGILVLLGPSGDSDGTVA